MTDLVGEAPVEADFEFGEAEVSLIVAAESVTPEGHTRIDLAYELDPEKIEAAYARLYTAADGETDVRFAIFDRRTHAAGLLAGLPYEGFTGQTMSLQKIGDALLHQDAEHGGLVFARVDDTSFLQG